MSSALGYQTYLDHVRTESARFREVLTDCDPGARVPACPDWDASDLLWHLAEVQLFWARAVRHRPSGPDQIDEPPPERPTDHAELLHTFDDCSHALTTELERADPHDTAWHWGPVQTVGASYSRQAHEALIHRLDAEQTAGVEVALLDPFLAADGVLEIVTLMRGGELPEWAHFTSAGGQLAIEMTDVGQTIRVEPGQVIGTDPESGTSYDEGHLLPVTTPRAPDAVVRGTAADLDVWLWDRRSETGIELVGDDGVLSAFRSAIAPALD